MRIANAIKRLEDQFLEQYENSEGENKKTVINVYRDRLNTYALQLSEKTKEILHDN